jgi:RHS repeat-associated protein
VPTAGTPQPFGFTGELHSAGQVYLRARWYAPGQGRFVSEDPFAGWATRPYSLHPYQYAYSNPVMWTDPTGECVGWLWGDPTCQFIGRDRILRGDLEWEEARPWAGAGLDVAPVTGDIKGFLEVFTGCDLVTGDDLGAWRWAGLVPFAGPRLRKLRMVRHLHDVDVVVDLGQHGDDLVLPPGARASGGRGSGPNLPRPKDWKEAEELVSQHLNIPKNTKRYRPSGYSYRVTPDFVAFEQGFIADSKFLDKTTELTLDAQLRGMVQLAKDKGVRFDIYTTSGVQIQKALQEAVESTGGRIIIFFSKE